MAAVSRVAAAATQRWPRVQSRATPFHRIHPLVDSCLKSPCQFPYRRDGDRVLGEIGTLDRRVHDQVDTCD